MSNTISNSKCGKIVSLLYFYLKMKNLDSTVSSQHLLIGTVPVRKGEQSAQLCYGKIALRRKEVRKEAVVGREQVLKSRNRSVRVFWRTIKESFLFLCRLST